MQQRHATRRWLAPALVLALVALAPLRAQAQFVFNLTPVLQSAQPGDRITLTGMITNSTAEVIRLTGGPSFTFIGPGDTGLTFDVADFQNNLPASLNPSDSYTRDLFVDIAPDAPTGDYIIAGEVPGEGATTGNQYTASDNVTVSVAVVPEPGSLVGTFLGAGLLILQQRRQKRGGAGVCTRRRASRRSNRCSRA